MDKLKAVLSENMDEDSWNMVEDYISKMSNQDDAREYLEEILDVENMEHKFAIDSFLSTIPSEGTSKDFVMYNKYGGSRQDEELELSKRSKKKSKQQIGKDKYSAIFPEKPSLPTKDVPAVNIPAVEFESKTTKKKERTKFVPLFKGDATKAVMLPGRNKCDCCATKHQLVNNCLGCGRIVCLQEGSGPCMTCGDLVCSREEQQILNRGSKKSEQLRAQLLKQGVPGNESHLEKAECDLKKAEEYKERLLDFDRTSARRTKVIDDEMDYFQSDSTTWLNPAEREKLKAREEELRNMRHANKRLVRLSLDFAGDGRPRRAGRNLVVKENIDRSEELKATEALYGGEDAAAAAVRLPPSLQLRRSAPGDLHDDRVTSSSVDPNIETPAPTFVLGPRKAIHRPKEMSAAEVRRQALRNQDAELRELRDEGLCISMHQPWASLLVRGIKTDEGRTWYSPHRGRLWIAATAKQPDPDDIKEEERCYEAQAVPREAFPNGYPTGCLLGSVDVIECLPQSDYRKAYPEGESGSPFVFVCCNPRELVVKFPITGKHKIYRLDPHVHDAARKGIERAAEFSAPA